MAYTSADLGNYMQDLNSEDYTAYQSFLNQGSIFGRERTQNEIYSFIRAKLAARGQMAPQMRAQALQERGQQFSEQMQEKGLAMSQDQLKLQREIAEANKGISQEQMALQEQGRQEALQFQKEQEESRKGMEKEKLTWEKQRGDTETARYNALVGQQGQQNLINNLMFGGLVLDKTGIGKWGVEGIKDIWKGISPSEGKYPVGGVSDMGSGFDYGGLPVGDLGAELNYDWGGYGNFDNYYDWGAYDLGELNYDWGGYGNFDLGGLDYGFDTGFDTWDYWNWGSDFSWDLGGYTGDLIGAL